MRTIRVPFFYGWVMLPVATAAQIATTPGQTFGLSVFNPYLCEELALSHSDLIAAYMVGTLLACLPVVFIGAMMDHYGIRRVMTVVVVLLGGACIFTSQVSGIMTIFYVAGTGVPRVGTEIPAELARSRNRVTSWNCSSPGPLMITCT